MIFVMLEIPYGGKFFADFGHFPDSGHQQEPEKALPAPEARF